MMFIRSTAMAAFTLSMVLGAAACAETKTQAPSMTDRYFKLGRATLDERAAIKPNKRRAKNVILFVGDGLDPTTVAAARIYDGQSRGEPGEENFLSFEKFPYLGMAKTYNTDAQTPDSAGTMSAMATGVKTKMGVISLTDAVIVANCGSAAGAFIPTIGELSEQAGLATGVVTTTRLTHATPAAVFAHAADREWESDANLTAEAQQNGCADIARQLIEFPIGDGLEVAFGGGRANFLPAEAIDPETESAKGARRDGRDLTAEWRAKGAGRTYVFDKEGFDAVNVKSAPKLLGLFEPSHMKYEADRASDAAGEPSLTEMTTKAIEILRQDKDGFFLMVEAGRIDHAHHAGNAARALNDAQVFSEAVAAADAMTDDADTLIIVTADHGHTLTFAGYPQKGNDILGLATSAFETAPSEDGFARAGDGKRYTTLGYANGPGAITIGQQKLAERHDPTPAEVADLNYRQQSTVPSPSESHGGQDVTIYAKGPHAYLIGGVVEQNYVFHVIDKALSLSERAAARQ